MVRHRFVVDSLINQLKTLYKRNNCSCVSPAANSFVEMMWYCNNGQDDILSVETVNTSINSNENNLTKRNVAKEEFKTHKKKENLFEKVGRNKTISESIITC